MSNEVSRTLTAYCSDSGAALKLSFDAGKITAEMRSSIEKRLHKKGVATRWNDQETGSELIIRIVAIDQGNQFLRWLLPFIAPAFLEVEGQVGLSGSTPQQFHYTQCAQVGLFGGSARGMLKVCAQRVAHKIASDVLRTIRS